MGQSHNPGILFKSTNYNSGLLKVDTSNGLLVGDLGGPSADGEEAWETVI